MGVPCALTRSATMVSVRSLAKRSKGKGAKGAKGGSTSKGGLDASQLVNVTKTVPGGRVILDGVSLRLLEGAKVGVLGANGAGKSTLLRIVGGMDVDFEGTATVRSGFKVGMLEQEPQLDDDRDVMSNVTDGVSEQRDALARFDEVNARLGSGDADDMDALLAEQSELADKLEVFNCWNLNVEVEAAMKALNVPAGDVMPSTLSGGQRRRVALCRLLLGKPDILLLDEPTNHLDATSVAWVEQYLASYKGAVMAVTHDRYFLDNVASWIVEVDRGMHMPTHSGTLDAHGASWKCEHGAWATLGAHGSRPRAQPCP